MAGSDLIGLLRVDGKWMGQLLKSEMDTERPMKRPPITRKLKLGGC